MKRLLIVDDSIDLLDVIKTFFEMKGYEVHTLAHGNKIFETIKQINPDLILLDVYLVGENGLDICSEIKCMPHLKDIPVIMMSSHSNLEAKLQACKPDAFINKPFNLTYLTSIIEEQLNKVAVHN